MGMRIHVGIGYGLDMTKGRKTHLRSLIDKDDYSQVNAAILHDIRNAEADPLWGSDPLFFSDRYQRGAAQNSSEIFDVEKCFAYNEEFFDENKVVFFPYPFGHQWRRYNDDIDYQTAQVFAEEFGCDMSDVLWKESKKSFYPYSGYFLLDPTAKDGYRIAEYAETLGNASLRIPFVPQHIRIFAKHLLGISEKDLTNTFLKIRPGFYRYWA